LTPNKKIAAARRKNLGGELGWLVAATNIFISRRRLDGLLLNSIGIPYAMLTRSGKASDQGMTRT
jgi:hypothetical protein